VRNYLGSSFILMNDIDLTQFLTDNNDGGQGWLPIGGTIDFTGTFNGAGHTISGLWINRTTYGVALFGSAHSATIKNVGVKIAAKKVIGDAYVGGLVGQCGYSTITNCYVIGNVIGNRSDIGGLIGYCVYSTITNCYAVGNVAQRTPNTGSVGGLIGALGTSSTMTNCYAVGTVNGPYTRGLVGAKPVSGVVINSFYNSTTSRRSDTGQGEPKTTVEMQTQSTFTGWNFAAGGDWKMCPGNYPILQWQPIADCNNFPVTFDCEGVAVNETTFPDANFRAWLLSQPEGLDACLSDYDIWGFRTVDVSGLGIKDLTGIEHFTRLEVLRCGDNQLTSLDVLALKNLVTLDCSGNQLTSLNLSGLDQLETLSCDNNQLTTLDVTGLKNLKYLYCSNNKLVSIMGLSALYIVEIDCRYNQLTGFRLTNSSSSLQYYYFYGQRPVITMVADGDKWKASVVLVQSAIKNLPAGLTYEGYELTSTSKDITSIYFAETIYKGQGGMFATPLANPLEGNYVLVYVGEIDPPVSPFCGGTGTETDPYQICTAAQLNEVRNYLGSSFILMNDIDLTQFLTDNNDGGQGWLPIGTADAPFTGVFNGNNKKITGLWINRPTTDNVGLFGAIKGDVSGSPNYPILFNVGVEIAAGKEVKGGTYVGGLVGQKLAGGRYYNQYYYPSISDCYVIGNVSGENIVGGLMGRDFNSSSASYIINCYAIGNVSGNNSIGGLIGSATVSGSMGGDGVVEIVNSYAIVNVTATGDSVGGLIGTGNGGAFRVTNCYAAGDVSGTTKVGGLVGGTSSWKGGAPITNCYAIGNVTGTDYVGGLVGYSLSDIANCYTLGRVIGAGADVDGLVGHHSWNYNSIQNSFVESVETMKTQSTFTNWDFSNIWKMCPGSYPVLQWQPMGDCANFPTITMCSGIAINKTTFPDINFRAWALSQTWGSDACISPEEIAAIKLINVAGKGIQDLTGINYFTGLTSLDCSGNQLASLNVSSLVNLESLYCQDNQLTLLDVSALTKLQELNCSRNHLTALDVSNLTNLSTLSCAGQTATLNLADDSGAYSVAIPLNNPTQLAAGITYTTGKLVSNSKTIATTPFEVVVAGSSVKLSGTFTLRYDPFCGGTGTATNPYKICTAEQLNQVRNFMDKSFILMNDIDLTTYIPYEEKVVEWENYGYGWLPIGDARGETFTGTFDGAGYKITGLWINRPQSIDGVGVGLFGNANGATISNLGVELVAAGIIGFNGAGGLTGYGSATITNCYVIGNVTATDANAGGLAGFGGTITGCYATGNISGGSYVGGLVGRNGVITNSYATGNVSGGNYVGGLVGQNTGSVTGCYATGNVNGSHRVGGLVGENYNSGSIANSYATGNVTASISFAGGLVGLPSTSSSSTITNCYSTGNVGGTGTEKGGLAGPPSYPCIIINSFYNSTTSGQSDTGRGEPKTTTEMKTQSTFTGWNFATGGDWKMCEGQTYPILQWQPDVICDITCTHDFSVLGTLVSAATCTAPAQHKAKCSLCGEEHATLLLNGAAALGHSFTKWIVNPSNANQEIEVCSRCGVPSGNTRPVVSIYCSNDPLVGYAVNATNFPDANFRAWILAQSWGSDACISYTELASIKDINVSGKNIADLTGINFFVQLQSLNCSNNQLTTLNISWLKNLQYLSCQNNKLTALDVSASQFLKGLESFGQTQTLTLNADGAAYSVAIALNNPTGFANGITYAGGKLISNNSSIATTPFQATVTGSGTKLTGTFTLLYNTVVCTHNFNALGTLVSAATCTAPAQHKAKCSLCGVEHPTQLLNGAAALGHNFTTLGTLVSAATCTAPAQHKAKCSLCGVEHPTQLLNGAAALGHNFTVWIVNPSNANQEIEVCSRCGVPSGNVRAIACTHNFNALGTLVSAATCTAPAQHKAKCSLCGEEHPTQLLNGAAALGHNFTVWIVNPSNANQEIEVCSRCAAPSGNVRAITQATCNGNGIAINASTFPDANFRAWALAQSWGSDACISPAEIGAIKTINVAGLNIADLTGINYFNQAQYLYCQNNQLTTLDVRGMTHLQGLDCRNNPPLTTLNVSGLQFLKYLDCTNNASLTILKAVGVNLDEFYSDMPTGIDAENAAGINLYPNPTTDKVFLTTEAGVKVFNQQGGLLYSGFGKEIDLSNYAKGVYFVQINGGKVVKVVKQ